MSSSSSISPPQFSIRMISPSESEADNAPATAEPVSSLLPLRVAVVGCLHGELEFLYSELDAHCRQHRTGIDLVLICGDFQAVRNSSDLQSLACPAKYRALGSFHRYYSGALIAPYLTLYIGGNHESSLFHFELPFGGWSARNIYFLGKANLVRFAGIRIGGLSGIFKSNDFQKPRNERPPFTDGAVKSIYHTRAEEIQLFQAVKPNSDIDIFLSHDWPASIHRFGDERALIKRKPFFKDEIHSDSLGSTPSRSLLDYLQPANWYSAHLHVKFTAEKVHASGRRTKFLALDKCVRGRKFFEIREFTRKSAAKLEFDPEWIEILRQTNGATADYSPLPNNFDYRIPENFQPTAQAHRTADEKSHQLQNPGANASASVSDFNGFSIAVRNPQTEEFCHRFGISEARKSFRQHQQNRIFNEKSIENYANSKKRIRENEVDQNQNQNQSIGIGDNRTAHAAECEIRQKAEIQTTNKSNPDEILLELE